MSSTETRTEPVSEVYFHLHNGGVTFSVTDDFGPTLSIRTSHFGNLNHSFTVHTDHRGLLALRDMLDKAIEKTDYGEPYCHAVTSEDKDRSGPEWIQRGESTNDGIYPIS